MNQRRVAELMQMRARLSAQLAEVDAELAAAFSATTPANETAAEPVKKRSTRPTLVRVPKMEREPSDLAAAQAEAGLRELGYR